VAFYRLFLLFFVRQMVEDESGGGDSASGFRIECQATFHLPPLLGIIIEEVADGGLDIVCGFGIESTVDFF